MYILNSIQYVYKVIHCLVSMVSFIFYHLSVWAFQRFLEDMVSSWNGYFHCFYEQWIPIHLASVPSSTHLEAWNDNQLANKRSHSFAKLALSQIHDVHLKTKIYRTYSTHYQQKNLCNFVTKTISKLWNSSKKSIFNTSKQSRYHGFHIPRIIRTVKWNQNDKKRLPNHKQLTHSTLCTHTVLLLYLWNFNNNFFLSFGNLAIRDW